MQNRDISNYQIDLNKLNQEIKILTAGTESLKKQQQDLNDAYNRGAISQDEFREKSKELNKQIQKNQSEIQKLVSALKNVNKENSNTADNSGKMWAKISGSVIGALSAITRGFEDFRKKRREALEAKELAEQNKALENLKNRYTELFNTEDVEIKELEKLMKRLTAEGTDSKTIEEEKSNLLKQQIKQNENLLKQRKDNLEMLKVEADAVKTGFTGTSGAKKYETVLFNIKAEEQTIKQIEERLKTLNNIQETYLEELLLKQLANNKKAADDEAARLKKAEEERAAREKKYNDEQKALREKTERAIEELQIQLIDDEKQKQIATIELNRKRALKAIKDVYSSATTNNKRLLDQQKKLIIETAEAQLKAIETSTDKAVEEAENKIQELRDFLSKLVFKFDIADPSLSTELENARGNLTEIQYEQRKLNDSLSKLNSDFASKMNEATEKFYNKINEITEKSKEATNPTQLAELNSARLRAEEEFLNNRAVMQEDFNNKRLLMEQETANKIKSIEKNTAVTTLNSWSSAIGGVGDIFNSLAELEGENSKKTLQLQKMGIYMNMASGLASGIAAATQAGWPAMLATIPSTIAMLISEFAQVKKLESQSGYATGGIVYGPGSGTSDSIKTNLSNGESVINARATALYAPLLDAINRSTGGAPIQTANNNNAFIGQLTKALTAQPAPVVSVTSIDRANTLFNKITELKSI